MRSELSIEDIKWAFLAIGICLILQGIHDFNYANRDPVNIEVLTKQDVCKGLVIEEEIPYNYGVFAWKTVLIIGILMVNAGSWMILSQYAF